jgi:hypothetical protein
VPVRRRDVVALVALLSLAAASVSCSRSNEEEHSAAQTSPIRFYREYVKVEPAPGSAKVTALYYFRNASDRKVHQDIFYPFPVDRFELYPRVIRVYQKTSDGLRPMGFSQHEAGVLWSMTFQPLEAETVKVVYVQDIKRPRAKYIVTTTRFWQRPIERAEFEFRVPASLDSVRLNFKPDTETVSGDTVVYYMRQDAFMPDEDLIVTWKPEH